MNISNKIIHDKNIIREMAIQHLHQYAEENPLLPVEYFKKSLSDNGGYVGNIQNYCNLFNTQNDIHFATLSEDIVPIQKNLRTHSSNWMADINKKIIDLNTKTKSFSIFLGSFQAKDIEELVEEVNSPSGKENLQAILNEFISDCKKNSQSIKLTSNQVLDFADCWQTDLVKLNFLKEKVDEENKGEEGKIKKIQDQLSALDIDIRYYDFVIIAAGILIGVGIIAIGAGVILSIISGGVTVPLITTGLTIAGTGSILFKEYMEKRRNAEERKIGLSYQLKELNEMSLVLDNYVANSQGLDTDNKKTSEQVKKISEIWDELAKSFQLMLLSIIESDPVSEETKTIIKLRLIKAIDDAKDLATFAQDRERFSILPVSGEEKIIPTSSAFCLTKNQPIDLETFRQLVNAQRKVDQFKLGHSNTIN